MIEENLYYDVLPILNIFDPLFPPPIDTLLNLKPPKLNY